MHRILVASGIRQLTPCASSSGTVQALAATGQTQWSTLATDITDRLVQAQDLDGAWLADEPAHTKYDQTAEVAIWLYEISTELERAAHQAGDPPDPASG